MKKVIKTNLSTKEIKDLQKQLNNFLKDYNKGIEHSIEELTKTMYELVIEYCRANNIVEHTSEIHMEYDSITNIGKVWSNNDVIIFNEMGTGIIGKNNPHPNPLVEDWKYCANPERNYEMGWAYPKGDGTYGWTKGLPSKHMFYSAFEDIKDKIGNIVEVTMSQSLSGRY